MVLEAVLHFFFIDFSWLSFFTQLRQKTWLKNHENWHSGRGVYKKTDFAKFKHKEI